MKGYSPPFHVLHLWEVGEFLTWQIGKYSDFSFTCLPLHLVKPKSSIPLKVIPIRIC